MSITSPMETNDSYLASLRVFFNNNCHSKYQIRYSFRFYLFLLSLNNSFHIFFRCVYPSPVLSRSKYFHIQLFLYRKPIHETLYFNCVCLFINRGTRFSLLFFLTFEMTVEPAAHAHHVKSSRIRNLMMAP